MRALRVRAFRHTTQFAGYFIVGRSAMRPDQHLRGHHQRTATGVRSHFGVSQNSPANDRLHRRHDARKSRPAALGGPIQGSSTIFPVRLSLRQLPVGLAHVR